MLPAEATLTDGSLYEIFLDTSHVVSLKKDDVQEAKRRLSVAIEESPEKILACHGKTVEEARQILSVEPADILKAV